MKNVIKTITTLLIAIAVVFPCTAIFNESDNLWINLLGFVYLFILWRFSRTDSGRWCLHQIDKANEQLNRLF